MSKKRTINKIYNIHNFLCQNFAAVCWNSVGKLQLPVSPNYF